MSTDELLAILKDRVRSLRQSIALDPATAVEAKKRFFAALKEEFGPRGADFAFEILDIHEARCTINYNLSGDIKVTIDNSKTAQGNLTDASQTAQNMVGVTGGVNNKSQIGDVIAFNQMVEHTMGSLDSRLVEAIKNGRAEIEELKLDPDEKDALLSAYGQLTGELKKPEPKKTLLQSWWGAIAPFASKSKWLLEVGVLLAQLYAISHGTPTA